MAETPLLPCCHPAQARAAADPMHGHFFEHGLGITHAPAGGGAADSAVTQLSPSCHPAETQLSPCCHAQGPTQEHMHAHVLAAVRAPAGGGAAEHAMIQLRPCTDPMIEHMHKHGLGITHLPAGSGAADHAEPARGCHRAGVHGQHQGRRIRAHGRTGGMVHDLSSLQDAATLWSVQEGQRAEVSEVFCSVT